MVDIRRLSGTRVIGGKISDARFYCTTTGAATLTLAALTVASGKTVHVDWGDGSSNDYTGSGARTHSYSGAGTFTVKMTPPTDITALTLSDNKITLNSADIKLAVNITTFQANALKAGRFDSADIASWRPTSFKLYSMPAGYTGTFNSSDISAWRPATIRFDSMPSGYAGTWNTADVSAWRPIYFRMISMPATYTITITAGGFTNWTTASQASFELQMNDNALTTAQVDQILADFWAGFPSKNVANGQLILNGSNQRPSGTLQAANPPTTGKEYAYELVNDTQNVSPSNWYAVTITA